MPDLPSDWNALCAVVFLLGLRHGFDPDHLAAIDGLTRITAPQRPVLARFCGSLFSLGHGAVVLVIAVAVGAMSQRWTPPAWFEVLGAWISIAFLMTVGIVNLRAVLSAAPGAVVPLLGIKAAALARLLPSRSPLGVAAVGALFALSFDTLSQAALFAVAATQFGGVERAAGLGLLFVLGMLVADGVNGWWMARLVARADAIAALASRTMSLAVSAVSLLVAGLGVGRLMSQRIEAWATGKELGFGAIVVAVVVAGYVLAVVLASRWPAGRGAT